MNTAYGFGSHSLPAPQGTLIALLAKGVITGNIPLNLVLIGAVIGLLLALLQLPILPIAIGLYLPLSLSTSTMLGSLIPLILKRLNAKEEAKQRGILAASGLIAGDACTGVILALMIVLEKATLSGTVFFSDAVSLISYLALAIAVYFICVKPPKILQR